MPDYSELTNKALANMVRVCICPKIDALSDEYDLTEEVLKRLESYDEEQNPRVDLHLLERMIINATVVLQDLQAIYRKETGQNYKPFL